MIDAELADKFVKKAANYTQHNINVMNEKGIIIASSDSARVGSFHEVAYDIMSADKEVVEVVGSDHFQGGRIGINMALIYKKNKIGVLGVSGEPGEIRDTAYMIKMALEVMLEYEIQNRQHYQKQNLRTRFVDGLLYQEEADSEGELTAISEQLGYNPHLMRIPILVVTERQTDAYKLMEAIRKPSILSLQDITTVTRNNNIIIFKGFRQTDGLPGQYKYLVDEMINRLDACLVRLNVECRYYVGSFQEKYCNYRKGYQHCAWLKKHCKKQSQRRIFFYDYVGEYMRNTVPVIELNRIFSALWDQTDGENRESIVELIETLYRNNYNLKESSQELFIHKNTLIFRYNKIKNMFNVNPIQSAADREFLYWLALYLKKNR